jgi:hypothetical protein
MQQDRNEKGNTFRQVYGFLKERYKHSRFEGSVMCKDYPDYPKTVTQSTIDHLNQTGISCISLHESKTGEIQWFDKNLNLLTIDEARERLLNTSSTPIAAPNSFSNTAIGDKAIEVDDDVDDFAPSL